MQSLTQKQIRWYESTLAAVASKGNRWDGLKNFTWAAASLGIPTEQAIADARAAGVTNRDADIRRGIETARAKVPPPRTRANGWQLHHAPRAEPQEPPRPDFVRQLIDAGRGAAPADLRAASPFPVERTESPVIAFLRGCYAPDEHLHLFKNKGTHGAVLGRSVKPVREWLADLEAGHPPAADCVSKNPLSGKPKIGADGRESLDCAETISAFRFVLVEFDKLPIARQIEFWAGWLANGRLATRLAALAFSGGKSLHGLVTLGTDGTRAARKLKAFVCTSPEPTERADPNGLSRYGGTRLPGVLRCDPDNARLQELLYLRPVFG